jgi:hypothetical protein
VAVSSGTVTIGTEPVPICVLGPVGAVLYTQADGVVIGGPGVTVSGPAGGVPLPSGQLVSLPGAPPRDMPVLGAGLNVPVLYGVSADGGQQVSFVSPLLPGGY